jgi:hypothetical protein
MSDATTNSDPEGTPAEDAPLAGAAGEDFSAGISTSSVGGVKMGEEPGGREAAGEDAIDAVVDRARRTGWGRPGTDASQGDDERGVGDDVPQPGA